MDPLTQLGLLATIAATYSGFIAVFIAFTQGGTLREGRRALRAGDGAGNDRRDRHVADAARADPRCCRWIRCGWS